MDGAIHTPTSFVAVICNNNTDTVIINKPPSKFQPAHPPSSKATYNLYKLKTQPKLVRYYHPVAGFPTKPTWVQAIKNQQFASWPGLTFDVINCHFPDSEETSIEHGCKAPSRLWSTEISLRTPIPSESNISKSCPIIKNNAIFTNFYDAHDKSTLKNYTDQTG